MLRGFFLSLMPNPDRVISHKPKTETLFMAKNTQEAEVIVTMNGQAAKKAVAELAQEYEKLQKEALEASKAGNDALGKKLDAQAQKLMKDIEITRRETKKFADVMKNINGASLKELRSAAKQLQSEINKLAPGTQAIIEKSKQLQQVNTRIRQLTNEFKGLVVEEKQATFSLKGIADGFNKYFGMVTAGIAAITGLSMAFRKAAEDAARLDDVYSDVMKTTGLLHEQVAELDQELMKINTRTSREQLLLLARDAGKLGIQGKENILGFVRAADQIQVALGEDLGEGAIRNLGKIADVLGYTKSMGIEKSLLSIASSINAVGQASTASESYLVDFTQRMAGVAAQTGISAANIIGFASGLDQSAMKVEMASTAFQKFLMKLYEDPAKFAAYANLEVGKFTELLKTDANQAVITILQALKDQDGFASLVPIFKDMGLDGARAVSVLAAMATNINAVTDAQALANEEFAKANSVTEEYNTKNNNLQANLEKARKEFQNASIALGQSLNPVMLKSTKAITYIIKALATYGKEIKAVIIALVSLTAIIKAQAIAEGIRAVALKISNTLQATGTVLSNKMLAAYYRLTGQTLKLAAAQKAANAAMSTSVIGAIAVAVAALTFAIARYVNKLKEANKELSYSEELEKKIANAQAEESSKVVALTKIVNDQNISYKERKKALEELKKIIPDYHADLTKEGELINNNKEAIDQYLTSLKAMTRMNILKDEFTELQTKLMNAEDAWEKASKDLNEAMSKPAPLMRPQLDMWEQNINHLGKLERDAHEVLTKLQQQEKELQGKIGIQSQMPGSTAEVEEPNGDGGGGGSGGETKASKLKKAFDARIKAIQQQYKTVEREAKLSLLRQEIDQAEYESRIYNAKVEYFSQKIDAARQYCQDETEIMNEFYDWQIQAIEKSNKQQQEIMDALAKANRARKKKEEDDQLKEMQNLGKRLADEQEILENDLARVKERIGEDTWKEELAFEMWKLEELHDQGIVSERNYQMAKLKIRMEYAQKAAEGANQFAEQASNFVTQLKEMESAQLEAEYQKQLTAAGDNAEEREAIEAEYEQKKLDLQKKYADTEMVINIAKAIAAGALAAIEAFAAAGNPILGAVFAAIIAATTALEVATIVKQRNAIKNTSVGGGGSSSVPKTGERKMTGYAEGGYTEDHTTLTTVGEKGREWVGPAWMVRKNPVMFANLERYRKAGSHGRSGSVSSGFADGGFTPGNGGGQSGAMPAQIDIEAAVEAALRRVMADGAIRAFVVRKDIEELDAQTLKFKKLGSR